ncbi:MAG: glycerophosphodiester phosphodiesterase, partial [Acidimicrobiales bacterium]
PKRGAPAGGAQPGGGAGGRSPVVVSSFSLASIDRVRRLEPSLATGWLRPSGIDRAGAMADLDTAAHRGHAAFHPHHTSVTPELVEAAHRAGLALVTWTVDQPSRARELAAMRVDVLITNRPAVLVDALDGTGTL